MAVLNDVQENLGFSLAKKLKKMHTVWEKHKMNVEVAAQTISASVADALGTKQPVTHPYFKRYWAKECDNLTDYIFALKDERGNLLPNGWYKTVIWEFAFSIQSVKAKAEELLYCSHQQFQYVLTYRFSQDDI